MIHISETNKDMGVLIMIKRTFAVFSVCIILLFSSCKFSDDIKLDYFSSTYHTATIIENDGCIFYAKSDGIYKNGNCIYNCDHPDNLLLYSDCLYFLTDDRWQLSYININSKEVKSVFSARDYIDDTGDIPISDYQVADSLIYISSGIYLISFDTDSGEIKHINDEYNGVNVFNAGVDVFDVINDNIYFIEHSSETFTVYMIDLNTDEKSIFEGSAEIEPETNICSDFIWIGNQMYFCQRVPYGIYLKQQDGASLIDSGNVVSVGKYESKLLYIKSQNSKRILCIYDSATGKIDSCELSGYVNHLGFTVVSGYLIYCSDNGVSYLEL